MASGRPVDELAARLADPGTSGIDIRDRADAVTDVIVDGVRDDIPVFRNAPETFIEVTRLVVHRIVETALLLFAERRLPDRAEVRDLVEVCVPPTDQGVSLEDLLGVFRISQDVLWWELHRLTDSGDLQDAQPALELSRVGVTLITEISLGVTAEYLRGDRVWLQRRDAERALISSMLVTPPRTEEATRAANALDLRQFGEWRCAAYRPKDGRPLAQLADVLHDARATWGVRGAIAVHGDAVVLATQGDEPLRPPEGVRVGIGPGGDGAPGLRRSHRSALEALDVAERIDADVLTSDDARLGRIVLGTLSPSEVADAVLAPIDAEPEGRRGMLLETLDAWLAAQGSATAAARALQLHVQSTRYRIDQLRQVLGSALDDPDQRLLLQLALTARRMGGADVQAAGTAAAPS